MDEKGLEILEFPRVRDILAGLTSFSTSREMALALEPLNDYGLISTLLRQSAEARMLLGRDPDFSLGGITDIRETARLASRGKVLDPTQLVEVQQTLAGLRLLHGAFKRQSDGMPLLAGIAGGIADLKDVEKEISRCITAAAEVLDTASPKLSQLRQQIRRSRDILLARFDAIIKSPHMQSIIQEPIITERDGRFVLPIKIESRKEIKGIIHDVSNTGATAFIEPWTTVEMGNELRELVLEERNEVERVLSELSARIGEHEAEIARSIVLAAELDLALAKARYAGRAHATEPAIIPFDGGGWTSGQSGVLRLAGARHPLLGPKAVPLSVEIGRDFSVLVITGPNTGGKTVALKTMGLLSLMALSGLPIPAQAESTIPVFDNVFADIGDEQSIEQTLSTFSWHMGNIVRILRAAGERSLVLLDELGTSTDPAEGSALARSVLLGFYACRALTVSTTHFTDLKAFAHATPGFQNASLDFDPATLLPTYHLTVGTPGGSNALATAARLGLPEDLISRAREMMARGTQELENLLSDLTAEKHNLTLMREQLQREAGEAEKHNTELREELERVKKAERNMLQETRDRIARESAELYKLIREAQTELKKRRAMESVQFAQKSLAQVREKLNGPEWQASGDGGREEDRIARGDIVWLKDTHVSATVLSVSEESREVEVQAGAARLTLGFDSVARVGPPGAGSKGELPARRITKRAVPTEIDLRGKRADEIEPALDIYLNDASLADLGEVRIIHGVGTGTVRKITRDFLAGHPLVKSFRSARREEGGEGATIAHL